MSGIDFTFTQISCTRCELFDTTNKLNHVQGTRTVHLLGIWSVGTVLSHFILFIFWGFKQLIVGTILSHFIPLVNNFPFILLLYISSLQQFSWLQKIIGDTQTFVGKHTQIYQPFKNFPLKQNESILAVLGCTVQVHSRHTAKQSLGNLYAYILTSYMCTLIDEIISINI